MNQHISPATLDYADYKDRVWAGWIGKSFGGVIGAPLECHKELKSLTLEGIWPDKMAPNDDLDLQVVWLEALQERGLHITSQDLAELWQDRCWYSFCEYGVFLNNLQRGIAPPLSGTWNNRFFHHSEGCPIRSDIWGYIAPNNPQLAADLARMDGQLDHGEISIQTEQFLAAMSSRAVLGGTLEEAIAAGLSVIPANGAVARTVPRVREIAARYPEPRQAWRIVIREFGDRNANDAITNHALTLLALWLGGGDMKRTMLLCAEFGWDTDCTASTAGALLGTLAGTAGLPQDWVEKLGPTLICGINVKHQGASLESFAEDTCRIGVEMAARRNPAIVFSNAPQVEIRPAPVPHVVLEVIYPAQPVLWAEAASVVQLLLINPTHGAVAGELSIELPAGVELLEVGGAVRSLTLAPGATEAIELQVKRLPGEGFVPDKNLFSATWQEAGKPALSKTFGLGGARQWQVYGPYWDMWDRTVNEVCPYNNDKLVGGPFAAGLTGDCYNHYADLQREYLDESALLKADLPEELPMPLELGQDSLLTADFGGFRGQGAYYLVRTIRSTVEGEAHMVLGRCGPYRVWLDSEELGSATDMRAWAHLDNANHKIPLTGKPQRLVIKLIRLTDEFTFSLFFMGRGDPDGKRGISNIIDCLQDLAG